jgi:outer membrane protein
MPLFNGGSLNSKVRQSMTAQDISKSQQQGNERAVIQQIRSVIRDIHTNVLSISARQQSIVSSKAALEAISEGFNVGTRNIVDLLDAEQAVFSAHNQYDNARLNHIKLLFNLEFQLGSIAEHNINKLAQWMTTAIKSSGFF